MIVSVFKNTYELLPSCDINILEVFRYIKDEFWRQKITLMREGLFKKELLPCFTPHGKFEKRNDSSCIDYSYIVHLDYDKLQRLDETYTKIISDKYTLACFRSPSGNGLKVFVKVDQSGLYHASNYTQVSGYFNKITGADNDVKCKNKSRLCYVSSDKDIFVNADSYLFPVNVKLAMKEDADDTWDMSVEWLFQFTEKKTSRENRNNFVFALACNCNRFGIAEQRAREIACMYYDIAKYEKPGESEFTYMETIKAVKSAYSNLHEHGKFKLIAQETR